MPKWLILLNLVLIISVAGIYIANKDSKVSLTGLAVKEVNQNVDKNSNVEQITDENNLVERKISGNAINNGLGAKIGVEIIVVNATK